MIYVSGISGTGMGPLALMAKNAGLLVCGSDLNEGAIFPELEKSGIEVKIGEQDGKFLQEKLDEGVDWFVYTSALPEDHPELLLAKKAGIKCTKRDDLTAFLVEKLGLKMVAVAGTHGKTTTTSMIVWAALELGLPVSYIVGTTLGFAPSGAYHNSDKYFIYEADEYDRNFLKFHPWLALITCVTYDHADIYKTPEDYKQAFLRFEAQSEKSVKSAGIHDEYLFDKIVGEVRRKDANLALAAISAICEDLKTQGQNAPSRAEIIEVLNDFPGVGRRFERLSDGVYTDYAHHPEEIEATINVAQEEAKIRGKNGVVVLYQPHQNIRQYEVRADYKKAFSGADRVLWLPTYLTREDPNLPILTPEDLMEGIECAEAVELDENLVQKIQDYLKRNYLVVLMTAGPADDWLSRNKNKLIEF
jgi:UDP-N-acetylmuramate--alanine ligase